MPDPIVVYPPGSVWGRPIEPLLHFDPAPLRGVPLSQLRLTPTPGAKRERLSVMHLDGEPAEPPFVYFVSAFGHLKVGTTSCDIRRRLNGLQTSIPAELTVEVIMSGGRDVERDWHELFAPMRSSGEWFRITPEIQDVIDLCRVDGLDLGPAAIIPGQERRWRRMGTAAYERKALRFDVRPYEHLLTAPTPATSN